MCDRGMRNQGRGQGGGGAAAQLAAAYANAAFSFAVERFINESAGISKLPRCTAR